MSKIDVKKAMAKVQAARTEFNSRMLERGAEIDAALVAMLAGENILLVGPPGTAKSMLADAIVELVHGNRFSLLMTKFTTPDEVFGPVSLSGLRKDQYTRLTDGFYPKADIGFLDEIFKSSSAILNTLLKVLNEGTYQNGTTVETCPLLLTVAASNEWPTGEGQQELGALFDRFVIRRTVKPVSLASREKLLFGDLPRNPVTPITPDELKAIRAEVRALPFSDEAHDALLEIVRQLGVAGIVPGDRRQRKAVNVVRAAAYLDGASEVYPSHLTVLADVLWDEPLEHPRKAAQVVAMVADPLRAEITTLLVEAEDVKVKCDIHKMDQVAEATAKLGNIVKTLRGKKEKSASEAADLVAAQLKELKTQALDATGA